jgi:hypothetical protein
MSWDTIAIGVFVLLAELPLVISLQQLRRDLRAMRGDVPKVLGASILAQLLIAIGGQWKRKNSKE